MKKTGELLVGMIRYYAENGSLKECSVLLEVQKLSGLDYRLGSHNVTGCVGCYVTTNGCCLVVGLSKVSTGWWNGKVDNGRPFTKSSELAQERSEGGKNVRKKGSRTS